jgi:hypothetical protein
LEKAKAGIICLTAGNLHSDWLLFEAGALSKKVEQSFVCPLLIDLKPSQVVGPLAQFQATTLEKGDALKLLKTLNLAGKDAILHDSHLEKAFEKWWPDLETILKKLPSDTVAPTPQRPEREMLEEILALVREQNRPTSWAVESAVEEQARHIRLARRDKTLTDLHFQLVTEADRRKLKGGVKLHITEEGPGFSIVRIVFDGTERRVVVPDDSSPEEMRQLVDLVLLTDDAKEKP